MVTGLGASTVFGDGVRPLWEGCLAGRAVAVPIPTSWRDYADYRCGHWAPLPPIDHERMAVSRVERGQLDPVSILGRHAAREALTSAGFGLVPAEIRSRALLVDGVDPERAGVFMGTGVGGASSLLDNHGYQLLCNARHELEVLSRESDSGVSARLERVLERLHHGPRFNPFVVSMLMPNAVSAAIGLKYTLRGPNVTVALACAAGTAAIGAGYRAVRSGVVDVALAGGAEYLDDPTGGIFRGFDAAGALMRDYADAATANRPFDERRTGFLLSQGGAAVLVLESMETAVARGAPILAEVAGYAESFDAYSMMAIAPDGRQIERMLRAALADAGVGPDAVDYVNAHGTGTRANDEVEAAVIARLFGARPRVASTKSIVGHAVGASGAIEAVVTVMSLREQVLHASLNLGTPIADLGWVRETAPATVDLAVSQSFAFGGHNAAVVLRRVD